MESHTRKLCTHGSSAAAHEGPEYFKSRLECEATSAFLITSFCKLFELA